MPENFIAFRDSTSSVQINLKNNKKNLNKTINNSNINKNNNNTTLAEQNKENIPPFSSPFSLHSNQNLNLNLNSKLSSPSKQQQSNLNKSFSIYNDENNYSKNLELKSRKPLAERHVSTIKGIEDYITLDSELIPHKTIKSTTVQKKKKDHTNPFKSKDILKRNTTPNITKLR